MLLRLPTMATTATICLIIFAWSTHFVSGVRPATHFGNETHESLICSPYGLCEPCPDGTLDEPFCQPFGNRRRVHCVNSTSQGAPPSNPQNPTPDAVLSHTGSQHPHGETLAWESCGRIVGQERADFYEFVACNVLFAIIALFILFARSRRLQAIQARHLAARIGLIRDGMR
ncbi:hypothetical protein BD779DRAFT_613641 [Infundibulicybe gibba]|nr:hypothetical protein BD779DRAFT_613641 [Infundibulicybe gibba]